MLAQTCTMLTFDIVMCPLQTLDLIDGVERNPLVPFRMPIVDRWRDMGTIIMGKSEAGFLRVGDVLQIMPNK